MLPDGVTTVLSQGDAGADQIDTYVAQTVRGSRTRVRLAINLSRIGESTTEGCFSQEAWADVKACVAAIERHREHIWGIAVNASHHACGDSDPREVQRRGLLAAEQTGLPLLYGLRRSSDWPFPEQLRRLRPGDVVTYCFRPEPHGVVQGGRVRREVREARERGVLFDLGHGAASFCYDVAETAIKNDFLPDTISTDLQSRHLKMSPRHSLPLVMSKLRAAGMSERDVLRAATCEPARVLRLDDSIGHLSVGAMADLTVLRWNRASTELRDTAGKIRRGGRWDVLQTVRAGELVK